MKLPKIIGQVVYTLGYPVVLAALFKSRRAYVAITCNDEALLTVDWLSMHHEHRLIGGGAKKHETPAQAVTREAYEEIGLIIDENNFKNLTDKPIHSSKNFNYYIFNLELAEKPALNTNNLEILYTKWIKRQDVDKYLLGEESKAALKAMGWL